MRKCRSNRWSLFKWSILGSVTLFRFSSFRKVLVASLEIRPATCTSPRPPCPYRCGAFLGSHPPLGWLQLCQRAISRVLGRSFPPTRVPTPRFHPWHDLVRSGGAVVVAPEHSGVRLRDQAAGKAPTDGGKGEPSPPPADLCGCLKIVGPLRKTSAFAYKNHGSWLKG